MDTQLDSKPGEIAPTQGAVPYYVEKGNAKPRYLAGKFRSLKWEVMAVLLAWWHLAPFLRWDRGPGAPDQAVLVDMAGRRAYFFFIEIWPQEVYYLTGLLLIAAITLFLMSALAGRVWCGFMCWQTVYTDLFVAVERLVIGDRHARMELAKQPFSMGKLGRLVLVNGAWMVISAACGLGFVLWFGDAFQMLRDIFTGEAQASIYLFIGVIGGFCFLLGGYARERVCVYMCPYARIQAAMMDEHSLVVSYEAWRGEPRAHVKGHPSFEGRGHCVDCGMCVQACPTGIDIRNGNQLACIGCGLCVDACNSVMDRFGLPRGLVSYDSVYNLVARGRGQPTRSHLIRPRTILYFAVLAIAGSVMLTTLLLRPDLKVDVLHGRAPLAVRASGQMSRNGYDYKILNMAARPRSFVLKVANLPEAQLQLVGVTGNSPQLNLTVGPDQVGSFKIFVAAPMNADGKNLPLRFELDEMPGGKTVFSDSFLAMPEE